MPNETRDSLRKAAETMRAASTVPSSYNDEERTIDVVFSTGARVRKYDWRRGEAYLEDLPLSGMDLEALNNGAHVLRQHGMDSFGLDDVFGSVVPGTARIEDGQAVATIKLSRAAGDQEIVGKVADGIVRKWSYGYERIGEYERSIDEDTGVEVRTWAAHRPYEISAVTVPADGGTDTRSAQPEVPAAESTVQEDTMTDEEKRAAEQKAKQEQDAKIAAAEKEASKRALAADAERRSAITESASLVGLADNDDVRKMLDDTDCTVDAARAKIIEIKAEQDKANDTRSAFEGITDGGVHERRQALTDALAFRARPHAEPSEGARYFAGMTLRDMARDCLRRAGFQSIDAMNPSELFANAMNMGSRAHSTTDFPLILADAVNKNFRAAFAQESLNFTGFAGRRVVSDFKDNKELQLGNFTSLPEVPEGAEIKFGTVGEQRETWALLSYGRRFGMTRQMMINDDLSAFNSIPARLASAVNRTMLDLFWALFTANANMSDGNALFSSAHSNITSSGGAPSVTQIGKGRQIFAEQTDAEGNFLSLMASHIIFPPDLADSVDLVQGALVPSQTSNVRPSYITGLEPVMEPRLGANSSTIWYMAAAAWESVVYGYLAGQEAPRFSSKESWETQGMEYKIEHDFGCGVSDWRGLYYNAGA